MKSTIRNNLAHLEIIEENYLYGLPINATKSNPIYKTIIEKAYREITLLMARYSRTVLVRVDLHPAAKNSSIIDVTQFSKSIKRKLEKRYSTKVAYQWVKEFGKKSHNTGIHWHFWFAIKIDKNQRPHTQAQEMFVKILSTWEHYAGGNNQRNHMSGWFYLQRNQLAEGKREKEQALIMKGGTGLLIDMKKIRNRNNNRDIALGGIIDECFYTVSYLAKVYSKVRRDSTKGSRVTGCSNLNTRDSQKGRQEHIEKAFETIDIELQQGPLTPKLIEPIFEAEN